MIRRFGTPPKKDVSYQIRPGAYAVLVREGRVLLTFQEEPQPEFQLPGGGIDPGEHTIPALRREITEETGWTIGAPVRLGAFKSFIYMPEYDLWAEKICHIFFARPAMEISAPTEESHRCEWASYEDAFALVDSPGGKHFLQIAIRTYC